MIHVATTMEVQQRVESKLAGDVRLRQRCGKLLGCVVERVDVGLVMLLMVKLHDLAGDGWLKRSIVI